MSHWPGLSGRSASSVTKTSACRWSPCRCAASAASSIMPVRSAAPRGVRSSARRHWRTASARSPEDVAARAASAAQTASACRPSSTHVSTGASPTSRRRTDADRMLAASSLGWVSLETKPANRFERARRQPGSSGSVTAMTAQSGQAVVKPSRPCRSDGVRRSATRTAGASAAALDVASIRLTACPTTARSCSAVIAAAKAPRSRCDEIPTMTGICSKTGSAADTHGGPVAAAGSLS
jgi:hypothetical protein